MKKTSMTPLEWIAALGSSFAVVGVVGAVVYSHATLKRDVRHMHKCQRLLVRLIAKNGRVLRIHVANEEKRFARIEKKLGVEYD